MKPVDEQATRLGFWATLFIGIFAWAPALYPGYWQALEGFLPILNVTQSSAIASVAVQPDLWRGTGRGAFLLAQPFLLLGASPTAAVRAVFVLSFVLGGLGVYVWLRERLGDRAGGLAGVLYMLWPPFLATVYIRGSVSDALVMGLVPLALAGISGFAERQQPSAAGVAVLSLLWIWRIQAGLAVWVTMIVLIYALQVEQSPLGVLIVGMTGAAGLASLFPLWSIQGPAPVPFDEHFLHVFQLLYGGWEVAPSIPGWQDNYPFQLGSVVLVLGVIAVWIWRRDAVGWRDNVLARLLAFSLATCIILVVLTLGFTAPIWRISGADRLLRYPWQVLLLSGPFWVLLAGSLPALKTDLKQPIYYSAVMVLAVLGSMSYLNVQYTQVAPPQTPVAVVGRDPNLVVLDAELSENRAFAQARLDITWQVLRPLDFDYNVFFQALQPEDESEPVVIAQLDAQPLDGAKPPTTWQPGDIYTDTFRLDLSSEQLDSAEDGRPVRYWFGFYDWRTGDRLPVDGGIDDKMTFYGE